MVVAMMDLIDSVMDEMQACEMPTLTYARTRRANKREPLARTAPPRVFVSLCTIDANIFQKTQVQLDEMIWLYPLS